MEPQATLTEYLQALYNTVTAEVESIRQQHKATNFDQLGSLCNSNKFATSNSTELSVKAGTNSNPTALYVESPSTFSSNQISVEGTEDDSTDICSLTKEATVYKRKMYENSSQQNSRYFLDSESSTKKLKRLDSFISELTSITGPGEKLPRLTTEAVSRSKVECRTVVPLEASSNNPLQSSKSAHRLAQL